MKQGTYQMIALSITLLLLSSSAAAAIWRLKTYDKNGWNVSTSGTYSNIKDCNSARKSYLKSNPDRRAVCTN